MEMVNITDWASSEIKTLEITHDLGNIRFPLRVRQFVPVEGDQLAQKWADGEVLKHHSIPPYAIANMEEAAQALLKYVDSGVAPFLVGALGHSESFYWDTYLMAFKYSQEAPVRTFIPQTKSKLTMLINSKDKHREDASSQCPAIMGHGSNWK